MDYKKKYTEALKRAKKELDVCGSTDCDAYRQIVRLFPELKESEDEEIRKEIIDYINRLTAQPDYVEKYNSWIAWLEKHKYTEEEIVTKYKNSWYNEGRIDGQFEGITDDEKYQQGWHDALEKLGESIDRDKLAKGVLSGVANTIMQFLDANLADGNMCLSNMECEDLENAVRNADWMKVYRYMKKKLEKQGEQKPQGKTALEAIKEEKVDNANKVEPKFKVGDWVASDICNSNDLLHIIGVDDNDYEIETPQGNTGVPSIVYVDSHFRPWTIQDAKDGDVLNSPSHRLIWIYKDEGHYHACVNMNYLTENVATNGLIDIPTDACPATKDEQTILLANIKKSGHEWDAEKKELKQKSQRMIAGAAKEALFDYEHANIQQKDFAPSEKEQWLGKACEWFYSQLNEGRMKCGNIEEFIRDFRKAMEE